MAKKMSEILEAVGTEDTMPEIKEQEFQGARTRFKEYRAWSKARFDREMGS